MRLGLALNRVVVWPWVPCEAPFLRREGATYDPVASGHKIPWWVGGWMGMGGIWNHFPLHRDQGLGWVARRCNACPYHAQHGDHPWHV